MAEFALELHPEKTRLIEFGRQGRVRPGGAGGRQAGDLRLPGLYPHLLAIAAGRLPACPTHAARPEDGEAAGDHRRSFDGDGTRSVAEQGAWLGAVVRGFYRLPRRAHQHARSVGVPPPCRRSLATRLAPAQPEGPDDMGEDGQAGRSLAAQAPDIPSVAISTLPRQTPKVGAVCGNAARTVLCGGRAVMRVPTAINSVVLGDILYR